MADKSNHFIDYVKIHVKAGDGGQGCISFLRDRGKPFGGPNGGDGGRGGSVYLEADEEMTTLLDFKLRPSWVAERGEHGLGKNMSGRSGKDIVLRVPLGTLISEDRTFTEIGEMMTHGQRIMIAKGGDGGRGNQHFATATVKAPRKAEAGWPGQEKHLVLELKVLADVGLVGLPNAGKSTMLSVLTSANPKIGSYPFTTLSPNLGVFESSNFERRITVADIPGLIEGAHRGAGLGDRFLRHVERTKVLVHLVAPEGGEDAAGEITEANADPDALLFAYDLVTEELRQYSAKLPKKPTIVCLTKIDLLKAAQVKKIVAAFKKRGLEIIPVSAKDGSQIDDLRGRLERLVMENEPPSIPQDGHTT
ncbi:GTPase ObgE [Candidatus Sumerlaeota bacterium]|nr:GTPase ObgE [Candidatus Sumerlaeota bacterium]HMZ51411.1 GTPase ObgE [Candidatus Sumerlaeota bacterium]